MGAAELAKKYTVVDDPGPFKFGQLLRRLRLAANLTQEVLAERAGVSTGAITAYERGSRSRPYQHTVGLLADSLGLANAARAEFEAAAQRRRGVRNESKASRTPLPLRTTTFIGRKRELAEVRPLLARERLLTLAGIGGSGKTSLAIEAVRELLPRLSGELYFVELASSTDSVASIVARALAVAEPSGPDANASLADALRDRIALLVLDNCEHVLGEVRSLVGQLLRTCASVRLLCTSRETLNVPGECIYRLEPLSTPQSSIHRISDATEFESVQLFVERARSADPSFALTDENVKSVCEACRQIDGIPLAIELVASRVKVLSPAELLQTLGGQFALLPSRDANVAARQRTIQATIEWSLDLLLMPERQLFEQLSVFAGGCTVESAREICFAEPPDAFAVLDLLGSLVDKSLLAVVRLDEQTKYTQLESFREYSSIKLSTHKPAEALKLRKRHAAYFRKMALLAQDQFDVSERGDWYDPLDRDGENIRAAIRNALSDGDAQVAGDLLSARRMQFSTLWLPLETMRVVETICVALEDRPPALAARLWGLHAYLATNLRLQSVAECSAERAVQLARDAEGVTTLFRMLNQCAQVATSFLNLARAQTAIAEAKEIASAARPTARDEINHMLTAAHIASETGDLEMADALYRQVTRHRLFDLATDVSVSGNLARLQLRRRNYRDAVVLVQGIFERGSSILDRDSTHHIRSILMLIQTEAHIGVHEYSEALALAQRTLSLSIEKADSFHVLNAINRIALIGAETGLLEPAAKLLGYMEASTELNEIAEHDEFALRDRTKSALATLPSHRFQICTTSGAMLRQKDAAAIALAIHLND